MDAAFWGLLCGLALLGMVGLLGFVIWFAASQHAWGLVAVESGCAAAFVLLLASGRERRPRERRMVQKSARWP